MTAALPKLAVGDRFTRLVVSRLLPASQHPAVDCKCDCGASVSVYVDNLRRGRTRSCGCLRAEMTRTRVLTHGHTSGDKATNEYATWSSMLARCYNVNNERFADYGGRGIAVCAQWHNFEQFFADMGKRPANKSLDRKNNAGDYTPENTRWATGSQQGRNKRNNRYLTYQGRTLLLLEWAERVGIKRATLMSRLDLYGWSVARALTTPVR